MAAANDNRKTQIINNLKNNFSGVINVPTIYSNIDVLTNEKIIIVKELNNWMDGIGILTLQTSFFPNKQKHLHIYNINDNNNDELNKIISATNTLNIALTIEQ